MSLELPASLPEYEVRVVGTSGTNGGKAFSISFSSGVNQILHDFGTHGHLRVFGGLSRCIFPRETRLLIYTYL